MRLKLQLFALNTSTSIVDYLKSQGKDSSYDARKQIASSLGIANYTGTAAQNTQMLNALKGGSTGGGSKPTSGSTGSAGSTPSSINGVDKATSDKMQSSFQQSNAVTQAQSAAQTQLGKVQQLGNVTDIIDQSTWDKINTPFQSSAAYQEAMKYTQELLQQLSTGRTSYTDQIKDLMGQIQNRDKFEYDVDNDVLFQQYLGSAMNSGKTAMMDTMGQASALTGGYGSTYATSAANQQYNAYIQDAYNNLPEYYQMALEAYQMEGEEMYNQLAMLNTADATEYQRLYDSWGANFSNAQNMYQQEYGAWQDGISNAFNSANLQLNEHGQLFDQAYNTYNAMQNNANTLYGQEFDKWQAEVNNAFNYAGLANSDYWNTQNFNETQRQFNSEMSYKDRALQQAQTQFETEMKYKDDALKQSQSQFETELSYKYDTNGDGVVDSKDKASNVTLEKPSQTMLDNGVKIFNEQGETAYAEWLVNLPSNIDVSQIDSHVIANTYQIPVSQRTLTKTSKNTFEDEYGTPYTISQLEQMGFSKVEIKELKNLDTGIKWKASTTSGGGGRLE